MFEEVKLPEEPTKTARSSLLSQLLEETLYQPSNPYLEFAKFDGEVYKYLKNMPNHRYRADKILTLLRFIPLLLAVFFADMWKPCQRN